MIFDNHFIANFLKNLSVIFFENWLTFDKVTAMSLVYLFMGHGVVVNLGQF